MSEERDKQAEALLGLSGEYTEAELHKAYAAAIRSVHPDTSLTLSGDAARRLHELRGAKRRCLSKVRARSKRVCPKCHGTGSVLLSTAVWPITCPLCKGEGGINDS